MGKKLFILLNLVSILLTSFIVSFSNNNSVEKLDNAEDEYNYQSLILDTMDDVDDYIEWRYGSYPDFSYTTEHNYGLLAIQNIDQTTLKDNYNNLGNLRHDLNHDNIINNYDNVGFDFYNNTDVGICQPTAVTMAIRYMISRGDITYTPQLNNDPYDQLNTFYDVAYAYIQCGWSGGSAPRLMCQLALEELFYSYSSNYASCYTETNLMYHISNAFDNYLPAIAHISDNEGHSHAMTIAGYYTKHITYLDDSAPVEPEDYPEVELYINYLAVNTGWVDTVYWWNNINSEIPLSLYEANYSFVDVNYLDGVTCICESNL